MDKINNIGAGAKAETGQRSVYSPAHEAALREDVWTVPERLMAGPVGQRVAAFCPKEEKKEVKI